MVISLKNDKHTRALATGFHWIQMSSEFLPLNLLSWEDICVRSLHMLSVIKEGMNRDKWIRKFDVRLFLHGF